MNNPSVLTLSQMHELQVLGLDCSDASVCFIVMMHSSDIDNLTLWSARYATVANTLPVDWTVFPAYTLQDLFDKFPYKTTIVGPWVADDGWLIEYYEYYPLYKSSSGQGQTILEAAFEFVKSCLKCGLIQPKEASESTCTLTKEAKEQLANEITDFLEKGKRIERRKDKEEKK